MHQLIIKISSAWSFLVPEILQIDEDKLQSFIETNDNLKRYEFDLKLINEKRPHILDAERDYLLRLKMHYLHQVMYGMFSNADLEFEDAVDKDSENIH